MGTCVLRDDTQFYQQLWTRNLDFYHCRDIHIFFKNHLDSISNIMILDLHFLFLLIYSMNTKKHQKTLLKESMNP